MLYYTYRLHHPNGKFYFGRHSTHNINDGYMGSGKWPLSIRNKSDLGKEILAFYESAQEVKDAEQALLTANIGDPLCMNFNNRSTGFATGLLNPANSASETARKSACRGDLNAMFGKTHSDQAKAKMSETRKGQVPWDLGKSFTKVNNTQIPWNKGLSTGLQTFTGKEHSHQSIEKMKASHSNRSVITCPHCGRTIDKPNFTRYHGDRCKLNLDKHPPSR